MKSLLQTTWLSYSPFFIISNASHYHKCTITIPPTSLKKLKNNQIHSAIKFNLSETRLSFYLMFPLITFYLYSNIFFSIFLSLFFLQKKRERNRMRKEYIKHQSKNTIFFVHFFRYRPFSIFVSSFFFLFTAKIFPPYLPQTPFEKLNGTFLPHTPWPFLLICKEIPVLLDYPLL